MGADHTEFNKVRKWTRVSFPQWHINNKFLIPSIPGHEYVMLQNESFHTTEPQTWINKNYPSQACEKLMRVLRREEKWGPRRDGPVHKSLPNFPIANILTSRWACGIRRFHFSSAKVYFTVLKRWVIQAQHQEVTATQAQLPAFSLWSHLGQQSQSLLI